MPLLRIPSHMSGEQYITKASLIADETMKVIVFPGTELVLRDYGTEAQRKGLTLVQLFRIRHGHDLATDGEVRAVVAGEQAQRRNAMVSFLRAGLVSPDRVTASDDVNQKATTSGSTATVAKFYREPLAQSHASEPPKHAQDQIVDALFAPESISPEMKKEIEAYYFSKLIKGQKYVLFWGRKSGETAGQGPWLDTNEAMLAQMMVTIRRRDPSRKLVLIGDDVRLPTVIDDLAVPCFDVSLVRYWSHDFPGGSDVTAQLYFLRIIMVLNPDSVSIGTSSGILELPHLMGMKTVYLENEHLHERKGLRWQLLAANYRPAGDPTQQINYQNIVESLRQKPNEQKAVARYEDRLRAINTRKVDILSAIRPGLQRFSTSTATELWSRRKALFDEIRPWLNAPPSCVGNPLAQDEFLVELIAAATTLPETPGEPGEPALAQSRYHQVALNWRQVSGTPFGGRRDMKDQALEAMRLCMETQHGLRRHELERFWEVFNYTYLGQKGAPRPPSWKAAYRGWVKDTEDIWAYVLSREF